MSNEDPLAPFTGRAGYATMGMDVARVISVIETTITRRGRGIENDPVRVVTQYWSLDGQLLAENDPFARSHNKGVTPPNA